jgi:hypothetical protein
LHSLRDWQAGFAAALLAGGGPPGMLAYRNNVLGNRAGALAGAYPVVRKIVGAAFFDAMAREYARACCAPGGDLNEFGGEFPAFLSGYKDVQDLPYLPDVARMDWLAHVAYYAADAAPFDFGQGPSAASVLRLAPACGLLESRWPLGRLWEVHQDNYAGPLVVDFAAGPDRILVHRPRWRASVTPLATGDYRFLDRICRGESLGAALEAAARDPAFDPGVALARWVAEGVIVNKENA